MSRKDEDGQIFVRPAQTYILSKKVVYHTTLQGFRASGLHFDGKFYRECSELRALN